MIENIFLTGLAIMCVCILFVVLGVMEKVLDYFFPFHQPHVTILKKNAQDKAQKI